MAYKANEYKVTRKNPVDKSREEANLDHGIYVGEVIVRPKDASHSGRIPVYIPMLSKDRNDPKGYFNCYWSSPFAGSTPSAAVGKNTKKHQDTMKTYGMWMVPPDPGNFVLVIFGDGKKKHPIIIGCLFPDQMQNMVPGNPAGATFGTGQPLPVAEKNRRDENRSHGKTVPRPLNPYIAFPIVMQGLINDPVRGITTSGARRESPSQVFGFLTPGPEAVNVDTSKPDGTNRLGGHSFVMDDNMEQRHIRMRTAGGGQVLIDDTNELVYVINSPGTAWVELSADGSIQIFSDSDLNMRATANVNIRADHTLNLDAGVRVNINAGLKDDAGADVDTTYLGGATGGDVYIQAGNSINELTNNQINMQTTEGGSSISAASAGKVVLYGTDGIVSSTPASTILESGGDAFISTGGSTNVVSGGPSYVKGSTVHLNDGGSTNTGTVPQPITPLKVTVFHDEPMSIPVFDYDYAETDGRNPLPTAGLRQVDPALPSTVDSRYAGNFSDVRGNKIKVASTTTMITTREPWFGHSRKDTVIPSPGSQENVYADEYARKQMAPGATDGGYNGPDTIVQPDGTVDVGVGYDDVKGPALQSYVKAQYDGVDDGTGNTPTPTLQSMEPDYKANPLLKSQTLGAKQLSDSFENGPALAATQDFIVKGSQPMLQETNLTTPGGVNPAKPVTAIGYKHILGDKEVEAGVVMFGDGKNFDPTSATTMIDTGKGKMSSADIASTIKNAGPGADLSAQGIVHASTVSDQFSAGDSAYAIVPKGSDYKDPIFINQTASGMSKNASKVLLNNDLKQVSKYAINKAKRPMTVQQGMALTMLAQSLGKDGFDESRALRSVMAGQSNEIGRSFALSNYNSRNLVNDNGKGKLMSYLWQSSDSMMPEIIDIASSNDEWQGKAASMYFLHRKQKGL